MRLPQHTSSTDTFPSSRMGGLRRLHHDRRIHHIPPLIHMHFQGVASDAFQVAFGNGKGFGGLCSRDREHSLKKVACHLVGVRASLIDFSGQCERSVVRLTHWMTSLTVPTAGNLIGSALNHPNAHTTPTVNTASVIVMPSCQVV